MNFKVKKSEILFHGRVFDIHVGEIECYNRNKAVHENFLFPFHK